MTTRKWCEHCSIWTYDLSHPRIPGCPNLTDQEREQIATSQARARRRREIGSLSDDELQMIINGLRERDQSLADSGMPDTSVIRVAHVRLISKIEDFLS